MLIYPITIKNRTRRIVIIDKPKIPNNMNLLLLLLEIICVEKATIKSPIMLMIIPNTSIIPCWVFKLTNKLINKKSCIRKKIKGPSVTTRLIIFEPPLLYFVFFVFNCYILSTKQRKRAVLAVLPMWRGPNERNQLRLRIIQKALYIG